MQAHLWTCNNTVSCHKLLRSWRHAAQGYGVQVSPLQAGTPALRAALLEVLSNPKYAAAARAMAVKIKAHPRTPVQEAAGENDISQPITDLPLPPYAVRQPSMHPLCTGSSLWCVADWIEHVMATDGEPYLRTPIDHLNIFARHSLDVYGLIIACAAFAVLLIGKLALWAAQHAARALFEVKVKNA